MTPRAEFEAAQSELISAAREWRAPGHVWFTEKKDRLNAAVRNLSTIYTAAIERAEQAEMELRAVDAVLARRPAIDDTDNRVVKIGRACRVAGEADALRAALAKDRAYSVPQSHKGSKGNPNNL